MSAEPKLWSLDDRTLVEDVDSVSSDIRNIAATALEFGLALKLKNCEVLAPSTAAGDHTGLKISTEFPAMS